MERISLSIFFFFRLKRRVWVFLEMSGVSLILKLWDDENCFRIRNVFAVLRNFEKSRYTDISSAVYKYKHILHPEVTARNA